MNDFKRTFGVVATISMVAAACGSIGDTGASGDTFPDKPIHIIVPYAPGGTSDLTARTLAAEVEDELGTSVVVENRPGGAGIVGTNYASSQEADGYTLALLTVELATYQYLDKPEAPKAEDFELIAQAAEVPAALTVRSDSPYNTYEDFINAVKSHPGELTVGNAGPGGIWHLAAGAIEQTAGESLNPVGFDGGASAVGSLMGGKIDAVSVSTAEVHAGVTSEDLKVLAVLRDERVPQLPDAPTATEQGHDVEMQTWIGFGAPAGTPSEIVDKLAEAFEVAITSEEFETTLGKTGNLPKYRDPKDFAAYVTSQSEMFEKLIPTLGITQ